MSIISTLPAAILLNLIFLAPKLAQHPEFRHTCGTMLQSGPLRGRPCSVCKHAQEREITTALISGATCRQVAKRYKIPVSTLARHHRLHLKTRIARAEATIGPPSRVQCEPGSIEGEVVAEQRWRRIESFEEAMDITREMRHLYGRTLALLDKAEASNDLPSALKAVHQARGNLELLARMDGSLGGPAQITPTKIEISYVQKSLLPGPVQLPDRRNE